MASKTPRPRPSSAGCSPRPKSSSMLYSMLPSVVQSRLPKLPSLQRPASMYGSLNRPKSTGSPSLSSGSRTPETEHVNAMVWSGAKGEEELYFAESGIEMSEEEDIPRTGRRKRTQSVVLGETRSGIGWKFANQGLNLLSLAAEESSIISQDARFGNASFARQLYLHAVVYLIRGLPTDLTTEEQLSIRCSLPSGIVESLRLEANPAYTSTSSSPSTTSQPSVLHRTLASIIVQLFILFQFILPHLQSLLSSAYRYERTHKISERALGGSLATMDALGKRGLVVSEAVLGMSDGRVGRMVAYVTGWLIDGVTGGIHEGLGQGMVMIGAMRPASEVVVR